MARRRASRRLRSWSTLSGSVFRPRRSAINRKERDTARSLHLECRLMNPMLSIGVARPSRRSRNPSQGPRRAELVDLLVVGAGRGSGREVGAVTHLIHADREERVGGSVLAPWSDCPSFGTRWGHAFGTEKQKTRLSRVFLWGGLVTKARQSPSAREVIGLAASVLPPIPRLWSWSCLRNFGCSGDSPGKGLRPTQRRSRRTGSSAWSRPHGHGARSLEPLAERSRDLDGFPLGAEREHV